MYRFGQNETVFFNPQRSLRIAEASIVALVINFAISALSLNTWCGNVSASDTQSRNVYRFSHPFDMLLLYGLCLDCL
ncbi:hypothetical protein ST47_g6006 [Ascochyta rabiei]|uniref:Uncharacterized protein n=1 Tax=Didymella rabiei TaxID=5454 RepID=A0A163D222_DIDRA|nr:hypothetical protein ST47_g6006 [Ascochyta rabiei]